MSPVKHSNALTRGEQRQRMLERIVETSKTPKAITARIWPRGRTDREAVDYVKALIDAEGTVELWGFGRTATRQIKRAARRLQFFEGFEVVTQTAVVERGDEAPVRTGIKVGPVDRFEWFTTSTRDNGIDSQTG